ncbi:fructose-bisphosphatase class III, partial [Staphylococcus epidermidis]|uniref:fructose-bisphosphatase class III n=1 Tax=Staphylococcus epidermidis TaxID=1282 RepID=UPI0011A0555D
QCPNHHLLSIPPYPASKLSLPNLLPISPPYHNLHIIQHPYPINLPPLLTLPQNYYHPQNPPFKPNKPPDKHLTLTKPQQTQITKIHQPIPIIQFKLQMPII